jgi:hypothetical protein
VRTSSLACAGCACLTLWTVDVRAASEDWYRDGAEPASAAPAERDRWDPGRFALEVQPQVLLGPVALAQIDLNLVYSIARWFSAGAGGGWAVGPREAPPVPLSIL